MRLDEFSLATPVGFMVDTTLAFARLILSGFLDRYPNAKLIAPHGGGTLPYLSGRLDRSHETIPACRAAIKAGQRLEPREMRELLLRLFATELPPHDVHGRSTIVQLPREELERRFGRR